MTKIEKIELLRKLQQGGVNRQELLMHLGLQIVAFADLDPKPLTEENEQDIQQWADSMGFIYDKKRQELIAPRKISEAQWAKMYPDGPPSRDELIARLQARHKKFQANGKSVSTK